MNPTPQLLHALAVAAKPARNVRDQLQPGDYQIDAIVRIKGQLSVGHPQPCSSTSSVPAQLLLAAVLGQFGPRKRIAIVDQILATIAADAGAVNVDNKSLQQAERLIRETTTQTPKTKNGNVTGKLDVSVVDRVDVPDNAPIPLA